MPADLIQASVLCVFPAMVIIAGLYDITTFTIPNWISAALALAFIPAAFLTGSSWAEVGLCVAVGLGCFILAVGMFAMNWIGGGDAKLMTATAVWMGFGINLVGYLVTSAFLGGLLTVAILSYRGSALAVYTGQNIFLRNLADKSRGIPYGIALAAAGLVLYPASIWMSALPL